MPYFHQAIEVAPRPAGGLAAFLRAARLALPLVLGATLPLGACAKRAPSEAGAEKAKEHATAMARPSVSDAAGPRAGAANAVPLFAANPQRTWVAGGVALGAPKRCEIVDAKVRATASTLPPKTVAWVNYNGQLRGVGKDEDRPAGLHETPTLAGGLVIVTDTRGKVDYNKITSKREAKPSQEAFLTALDLSTGKVIWRKDLAAILEAKAEDELSRDDHEAGKTAEVHYLTAHFTLLGAAYVIPLAPSGYALCSP